MKKTIALLTTLVMLFAITACKPTDTGTQNSSNIPSSEQTNFDTEWDMTKVSSPKSVDSFDIPVLVGVGGDVDVISNKLYYNSEVSNSGYFKYKGTYNGRHYFYGLEDYAEGDIICSCDEKYEDFKKHSDIPKQIDYTACLYNGILYNWYLYEKILYAYDLQTNKLSVLLDASDKNYGSMKIISITDGWILSRIETSSHSESIMAYNIQTGETLENPCPISCDGAVGTDGILYGFWADELASYDPVKGELTEIGGINAKSTYTNLMVDKNGDVWALDYHEQGENHTVCKVYEAKSANSVQNYSLKSNKIINGWYYYEYEPENSDKKYLARLNLSTGETEYCKNIEVGNYPYYPTPYYWGKVQSKTSETEK